jgi:ATP-binding cassette subfamily F protein 3
MITRIEKQIGESEWQISKLEDEITAMDKMLTDPSTIDHSSVFDRYGLGKKQVEAEMKQWELLNEELKVWEEKRTW